MKRWLLSVLCLTLLFSAAQAEETRWALAIHGGAGESPNQEANLARAEVLKKALLAGREILEKGGSSLECVEVVVRLLEDAPEFNAGKGAVFNAEGKHELDASIMDGRTLACGAVAGLRTVKNPISLARLVMTQTRHVLLAGEGAEQFAGEQKVERVENSYFSTPARRRDWEKAYSKGTVGCVALDKEGNLAAATSTGGLTGKKWGRVGDSPVIGAGTYADNRSCAVSCTGTGEEYIRRSIAHDLSARMLYGEKTLETAAQGALGSLPPNTGGLIAVAADGSLVLIFNTAQMASASADSKGRFEVSP